MIAMTPPKHFPIGLQLGPDSVTLAQFRKRSGQLELSAFAHAELPSRQIHLETDRDQALVELIRQSLRDGNFKGRNVLSCLGMEDLFVQNVRLPKLSEEETEKVLHWEAVERLPYPIDEAETRHWLAAEVRQGDDIKQELILMSCRKSVIDRHIQIVEGAGLTPVGIDVEPCAILRGLAPCESSTSAKRHVCLNLGEQSTSIIIESNGRIQFLKHIDGGGAELNRAVADHLQLEISEAAKLREQVKNASTLDSTNEIHCCVIDAIRESLEDICDEIERCLRYDKVTFREQRPEEILVTGPETSPWLLEFISQRLGILCRTGDTLDHLNLDSSDVRLPSQPWQWMTAIGLSMKNALSPQEKE
ncbi:MAG: type IV pilus assembly protein PilM [Planctomycetaceae bacterium]